MGAGEPQSIKTHDCIIGLDKDRHHGKLYKDNPCRLRCSVFHLNLKETGDAYQGLETRPKELKQKWLKTLSTYTSIFTFSLKMGLYPG